MSDIEAAQSGRSPKRVLITGAAGRIGSALQHAARNHYSLRLADRFALPHAASDDAAVKLEISDLASCRSACQGIHTVVHLAGDANPEADFHGSLLPNNIVGTFNMFRAAADSGCRRMIFASSAQAVEGYPLDYQVHEQDPLRPHNLYGVSKCFGEALASYFSDVEGLSCIVVRIANYNLIRPGEEPSARDMSAYLSESDGVQLLLRCIDVEDVDHAVVHGVSNNRFKRLDISGTRRLLGYSPHDDAFAILGHALSDPPRPTIARRPI
jgi:NAD+ dependent glucose-6-phosphate dehydrogenase